MEHNLGKRSKLYHIHDLCTHQEGVELVPVYISHARPHNAICIPCTSIINVCIRFPIKNAVLVLRGPFQDCMHASFLLQLYVVIHGCMQEQ